MEAVAVAKKSQPMLARERFALSEEQRHDFVVNLPMNLALEDALEPSFWAFCAVDMVPFDHIQVRAEDGSWCAYLIVQSCDRNWARVVLDRTVKMVPSFDAPASSIKHKVEWKGPQLKWSVIRVSDSSVLKKEMQTKEEAAAWMREHERTVGP